MEPRSKIIKNKPELIRDLEKVLIGEMSPPKLKYKIDRLEFQHDCSDGFEDILDVIRPFISQLTTYPDYLDRELLVNRIKKLIDLLKSEANLVELNEIPLKTNRRINRIDIDPVVILTFLALVFTFVAGIIVRFFF